MSWERLVERAGELDPDPEFAGLDDEQLVEEVGLQAARVTVETARWTTLVAELVVRGTWAADGARTPGQWLSWKAGLAPTTARDHLRVGLALRELPKVRARFLAGTLSYSKVRAITRVADPECQDILLRYADSCPAHELERIIRRTRQACRANGSDPDVFADNLADPEDPDARVEDFDVRQLDDGTCEVTMRVDVLDGLRLQKQVRWLASHQESGQPLVAREVRAVLDAIDAAMSSVPADALGEERDVLVVEATLADSAESATPQQAELVPSIRGGSRPAMDRRALRRLACTASTRTILVDEHGCPLDVGRSQRSATAAQRRALLRRDGGCRFPGCGATRHLHAHHAREWGDGGATDMDNLVLLCGFHHRFVHQHDWTARASGHGQFTFHDHTGARVSTGGDSAESLPVVRRHHDDLEADGLRPRWWDGDRIDWDLVVGVLAQELERRERRDGDRHLSLAA